MDEFLWLCGRYKSGDKGNIAWDFQGIFDSKDKAINACRDYTYFICTVVVNESLPDKTSDMPNFEYPFPEKEREI